MKKYALFFLSLVFCATTFAANLNPYAYNLKKISYDDNSKTLVIGYSLNAPADSIFVYAEDAGGRKYQLCHIGARGAGDHTESLQLLYADDVDILPRNEQLTWGVAAKGKKYSTHQTCDRKISSHTPFSIAIDKNPDSDYFGRIITTQTNNNYSVGLYVYDASFRGEYYCLDPDVYLGNNQNWYDNTFLTPYRVRIIQDGSGRVLVSSAAVGQPVYLWALHNPNDLNDWTPLIYSHIMKEYAPVGLKNPTDDSMGNIDFDLKIDGDKLDILLFGSSLTGTTTQLVLSGNDKPLHSGIYSCNLSNLQGGQYQALTEDDPRQTSTRHPLVTNSNYNSLVSAQTAFDEYGGVWFCGYNTTAAGFADYPSLYHLINGNSALSQSYSDDSYLLRKNVGSAAICYNKTFDRFAISQGNLVNEARIYNVSQAEGAHPVLSNGSSVSMTDISGTKLIADMCWDYADNLYLCVRNRDAALQGVWVIAAALNGDATSTPAPINKGNEFTMTCRDVQHRVTATSSISMSCKIQNADGTDFVDGLYNECSKITLKAVPSAGYKFLGWKKDGNLVSTDLTYSFYVTQETNIMAMFEYAVYNVEWYNLFQSDKDVTDYIINPASEMDGKINSRLWRLFQWQFNTYSSTKKYDQGTYWNSTANKTEYHVVAFLSSTGDETVKKFMTTEGLPFYWLGKYILHVANVQSLTNDQWKYHLYSFFNRTDTPRNSSGSASYGTTVDFSEKGKPTYWRSWWAEYACNLKPKMAYNDAMPTDWNKINGPADQKKYISDDPRTWYIWNPSSSDENKLLAWYYGDRTKVPSQQTNKTIVRNIDHDGYLFATWVDKLISEPKEKDQNNSDVIYLLNHHNGTHDIKIERRMQGGMYNTLCLPFDVNQSQLAAALPGATVMRFTGVDEDLYDESGDPVAVLNFTQVTSMEAGVPYLVKPAADITDAITFSGITTGYNGEDPIIIETAPEQIPISLSNGGSVSFQGTILSTKVYPGQFILVANDRIAMVKQTGDMAGMRGHFIINDPNIQALAEQGRVYLSMKKPVTTSIPVAPEAEQPVQPKVRKVMHDGKIYILRGDEVYTITGNRVR